MSQTKGQWKKIKASKDIETGENKSLWRKEAKWDDKYPYRFKVMWQWESCKENQKTMWDEKKAIRLYECIDINGWEDAA